MNKRCPDETRKQYKARFNRDWRAVHPDIKNDATFRWRINHPDRFKASQVKYFEKRLKAEPGYWRDKQRKYNGLPQPTRKCPDVCEACGMPEQRVHKSGTRFSLSLDHCHDTGKFRGWLCGKCNTTEARYKDDVKQIRGLARYLAKFDSKHRNA